MQIKLQSWCTCLHVWCFITKAVGFIEFGLKDDVINLSACSMSPYVRILHFVSAIWWVELFKNDIWYKEYCFQIVDFLPYVCVCACIQAFSVGLWTYRRRLLLNKSSFWSHPYVLRTVMVLWCLGRRRCFTCWCCVQTAQCSWSVVAVLSVKSPGLCSWHRGEQNYNEIGLHK